MTLDRVAVVGGGIAGLAVARRLSADSEVVLFEADPRLGGKFDTEIVRGRPVDLGADSFITRNGAARELCEELGLGAELAAPQGRFAALDSRVGLIGFPAGLAIGIPTRVSSLRSAKVVSRAASLRAALDYLLPGSALPDDPVATARAGGRDDSVARVVGRRLGRGVLYGLVDPLVGGINASDVDVLSFAAALPELATRAGGQRVLMRALRAPTPALASAPVSAFLGLSRGISSLSAALERDLGEKGVKIRTNLPVGRLERARGASGFVVGTDVDDEHFDAVVLALPAHRATTLVAGLDPALSSVLGAIEYSGVVTAALVFRADAIPSATRERLLALSGSKEDANGPVLPGNGVLIPRPLGRLITAVSFLSSKWPNSTNDGEVVLKVSAGRHRDERALALNDAQFIEAACADLRAVLGITTAPLQSRVARFERSFPQYTTGHLQRVARIDALARAQGQLAFAGAAYHGIGIPACIDSGYAAAARLLDRRA